MRDDALSASKATILRMPVYLRYLRAEKTKGVKYISSATVAKGLNVSAISVRKDFAMASSVAGRPRIGFEVELLIKDIEKFLGYDHAMNAVVIGAGSLGRAFMGYEGFKNYGMNIVSAFDVNESVIGTSVSGKPVYSLSELGEKIAETDAKIAILTVPKTCAQDVCNMAVKSGIKAIWNFASVRLSVPDRIVVRNEDLAASLALLSVKIK